MVERAQEARSEMSLDVYLEGPAETVTCVCSECDHEHTRVVRATLYQANITHNLGAMAEEAGLYMWLWRPDELGVTCARELIEPLKAGLALLRSDPAKYEAFNAPNGWGLYKHFVPFVAKYLAACEEYPEATARACR